MQFGMCMRRIHNCPGLILISISLTTHSAIQASAATVLTALPTEEAKETAASDVSCAALRHMDEHALEEGL